VSKDGTLMNEMRWEEWQGSLMPVGVDFYSQPDTKPLEGFD
jgi:hypothetical protein